MKGIHKRTIVVCKDCGLRYSKRNDTLKTWQGRCVCCTQKIIKGTTESRRRQSMMSRIQVLKQGGIPNANKFTSERTRGEKNNFWKGGITPLAQQIRTCTQYESWRLNIFMRDDFTCQECGIRGVYLHAHHIKPFYLIKEKNMIKTLDEARECDELWDLDNGITLCRKCHKSSGKHKIKNIATVEVVNP